MTTAIFLRCCSLILVAQSHALIVSMIGSKGSATRKSDLYGVSHLIYYLIASEFLSQILAWFNHLYEDKLITRPVDKVGSER